MSCQVRKYQYLLGSILPDTTQLPEEEGKKAAWKLPQDFKLIKRTFNDNVLKIIKDNNIPDDLVMNFDQTGCKIVHTSDWKLEKQWAKQVGITGLEDKRQITVLIGSTKSGNLLAPQLLYEAMPYQRCGLSI